VLNTQNHKHIVCILITSCVGLTRQLKPSK